ncbi:unnamed protein product [Cuscuta epithymum]|uniref:Uncharacterized protein n=1 Tax=Cuscuta epithymum TaxID=186058 RepID=A0AAV0ED85_9ASTE|nr:unnamed protein product [Cuscuta epithymum]
MNRMRNHHFYCYLCYQCYEGFRSPKEVTSCHLCLSQSLYEIQSITFYLGDIENHRAPPLVGKWQSRYHKRADPLVMLQWPGIVICLIWRGKGEQPRTTGWKGGPGQLQTAIEQVMKCGQLYWCYHCRKLGHTRETNGVESIMTPLTPTTPEIMRCQECSGERAVRFTDATIDNHDPIYWCYGCRKPYHVGGIVQYSSSSSSSSSSEPICPQCGGDQFMSPVRMQRSLIIHGDAERDSPTNGTSTEFSWFLKPLSHAWWVQDQREYFWGRDAALGRVQLNHILGTIHEKEPYPPRGGGPPSAELTNATTADAASNSKSHRATGQEAQESRTCLEELSRKDMKGSSSLNLRGDGGLKLLALVAAFIGGLLLERICSLKLNW